MGSEGSLAQAHSHGIEYGVCDGCRDGSDRRLTSAELADWQPLFDNAKKIRSLLAELHGLTLQIVEAGNNGKP